MSTFDSASTTLKSYDTDLFLGRLVWYSVSEDLRIKHEDFHRDIIPRFADLNVLPPVPAYPKASDIFKRACTNAHVKGVGDSADPNISHNYLVRKSGHDDQAIWQTIVREDVDSEGHSLSYTELVRVTFNRHSEKLKFNNISVEDNEDPVVNTIVESIVSYFHEHEGTLTAYTVREWVRAVLEKNMIAVRVRASGGVYFVSEDFGSAIDALDEVLNSYGDVSSFHYLPLIDDGKQREMLRTAFEEESINAIDSIIADMAEITASDKKISSTAFARYKVEYDRIKDRATEYSGLLDEKLEATHGRLDIMEGVLIELMGHVDL